MLRTLFLVTALLTAGAWSQDSLRTIHLTNGDVITATILDRSSQDRVVVRLPDGGTRTLPRTMIRSIETVRPDIEIDSAQSTGPTIMPRGVSFGALVQYFRYREELIAPMKSEESGALPGVWIRVASNPEFPFTIGVEGSLAFGNESYDGSTQEGIPRTSTTHSTFLSLVATAHYRVTLHPDHSITPVIGYGYRSWDRDIQGQGGYEEVYSWTFLPIGARWEWNATSRLTVGGDLRAHVMLGGDIRILFSKLVDGAPNITLHLGTITGVRVALPVRYTLSDRVALEILPFWERYGFGKSNSYKEYNDRGQLLLEIHEPASTTTVIGFQAGLRLGF